MTVNSHISVKIDNEKVCVSFNGQIKMKLKYIVQFPFTKMFFDAMFFFYTHTRNFCSYRKFFFMAQGFFFLAVRKKFSLQAKILRQEKKLLLYQEKFSWHQKSLL